MARAMEIVTPLGEDVLLFHGMHARDELGRLSEYQLDLLSTRGDINLDELLGKSVTVKLALEDDKTRYFNGYVTRFAQSGTFGRYHRYFAVVRPWLWFLSRTADCRIFQDMTVPDILEAVFADHDTADFSKELSNKYRKWTYCVQYRETDLNFVTRLMEHEGIYYYFRHTEGHDTLVVADSVSGHAAVPGAAEIPFIASEALVKPTIEHIDSWEVSREIQPGVYAHDDYDFERPSVELKTLKKTPRKYSHSQYEVYDYPGGYIQRADGEQYASVRIDECAAQFEAAHATTNVRALAVGALFTLEKCPRADQNREHLVVAATADLEFGEYEGISQGRGPSYGCTFAAMASKQQFRPKRSTPKPFVQGPQTAVVVGPSGEEIYTDEYGRVKVQFHWDRLGEKNQKSSCWVRVSHPWAGKGWGAVATPRIGQEVIVDFLEGDPDQPIVTGRVYNAENPVPYELPANKTQSGIKSRSSLGGTPDNFNEIRFEDKKGEEQLFIHAEKNQDIEVEHDETHSVGNDRTKTIENDETTHVKHDRTETVDNDETITVKGNRVESVGKDESISIGRHRTESVSENETIAVGKDRSESVGDNESISVGKDQTVDIGGNKTLTVGKKESISVGDSRTDKVAKNEEVSIGKSRKISVGEDDALDVSKKLVVNAGEQITIQTGSASIIMKKDGTIAIKGKDITIEGSGKINVKASGDLIMKGSKIAQN